jgi:hypothetical protein
MRVRGRADAVTVESEDTDRGAESHGRHWRATVVEDSDEGVVRTVERPDRLVLNDGRRAVGVQDDQEFATRRMSDSGALIERRSRGRRTRCIRGCRVDAEDRTYEGN